MMLDRPGPSLARRTLLASAAAGTGLWLGVARAQAQAAPMWPRGPVKLMTPYAPGGTTHNLGSVVAAQMALQLGVPVRVEDRDESLGEVVRSVARSQPDGHTAMLISNAFLGNTGTRTELGYDPLVDFDPVGLIGRTQVALITRAGGDFASLQEMKKLAPSRRPLVAATFSEGSTSHLAMQRLSRLTGVPFVYQHYRGQRPAVDAVLAGRADLSFINSPELAALHGPQQLRVLAAAGGERLPSLPNVPTLQEQGFDILFWPWIGIAVPSATPDAVVDAFNAALNAAITTPFMSSFFSMTGVTAMPGPPARLRQLMQSELARSGSDAAFAPGR